MGCHSYTAIVFVTMGNKKNKRKPQQAKKKQPPPPVTAIIVDEDKTEDDSLSPVFAGAAVVTPLAEESSGARFIEDEDSECSNNEEHTTSTLDGFVPIILTDSIAHFDAIQYLFQTSPKLQKKWINMDYVIEALGNLTNVPRPPISTWQQSNHHTSIDFISVLLLGLGKENVGNAADFEIQSAKNYFIGTTQTSSQLSYFLYVDLSPASKVVPFLQLQSASTKPLSHLDYFPVEALELTNYWYSKNAVNLFEPHKDETAFEAAVKMQQLLAEAANNDIKLRELIDGLGVEDELPVHKATGAPVKFPEGSVEKLMKHKKILEINFLLKSVENRSFSVC